MALSVPTPPTDGEERSPPGRGEPTRRFQGRVRWYLLDRTRGVQILAKLLVHALVVNHKCVPCGQRLSVVFGGEAVLVRRGGSGTTLQRYGSHLELGVTVSAFNPHVVKTISGALCRLFVTHECLPCKSLMYLIFLALAVV